MTKDWSGNGKSTFITIGASNHTDKEREEHDFYATSPVAIDRLVRNFELPKKIWECACGTGCLSERLIEFGHDVVSTRHTLWVGYVIASTTLVWESVIL
jgi:hypothetical protein